MKGIIDLDRYPLDRLGVVFSKEEQIGFYGRAA